MWFTITPHAISDGGRLFPEEGPTPQPPKAATKRDADPEAMWDKVFFGPMCGPKAKEPLSYINYSMSPKS